MMRKRLFEIIETAQESDIGSIIYDIFMMVVIIISLIPLAFKEDNAFFFVIDKASAGIFIIDYLLRLLTADLKLKKGGWSFLIYPVTPMALIDLVSILPSVSVLSDALRILKVFRLMRTLRVLRVFKAVRYSKSIRIIKSVFRKQRKPLIAVGLLAVIYILISALVVFNVEPDAFQNFFEAIYWATVSLTTMGYGDIVPVTTIGRLVTIVSSIFGIAIIAMPSGIITAGFMRELTGEKDDPETDSDLTD